MGLMGPGAGGDALGKITQKITTQTPGAGGVAGPASPTDVTRFQEALKLGGQQAQGAQGLQAQGMGNLTAQSSQGGTLGDSILSGIKNLSSGQKGLMNEISKISSSNEGGAMGMQNMMKLQYDMMQMSMQTAIVSKIGAEVSTATQTLFRNQ